MAVAHDSGSKGVVKQFGSVARAQPSPGRPPAWFMATIGGVAGVALVVLVASDALGDVCRAGLTDAESSHILLVPVVVAWLFWVRRGRVRRCGGRGRWPGALILTAGVVLWAMGYHFQVQTFWHGGAVLMVAGAALTVLGRDALWNFLPVWGVLLFLIPVPGRGRFYIAGPLERVTAQMTQSVGEAIGMNVGRSGNQLSVNGVDVCVAEACNGMRLAFTLLLACYVATFYRPLKPWVRVLVLVCSPIVAVAANVVRLVPTVWVFGHYPPATAERFHDVTGWVMLVLAFGFLVGLCHVLEWLGLPVVSQAQPIENGRADHKELRGRVVDQV